MELFIHSLSGAFPLCFQLTCKLHWSHLRKALSAHLLMLQVIYWIFACPIALLCERRYLKICSDCSVTRKGARDDREHFSHFIAHRICYLFRLPTPSFLWSPWFLKSFLPLPHEPGAGDPSSRMSECIHQQGTPITTLSSKSHVHKVIMCSPQKACQGRLFWGTEWPCRRHFLIFIRWVRSWGNGHHQNHCRGFLLAWLHPEFHHPRVCLLHLSCCPEHPPAARGTEPLLCSGLGELILLTHIWKRSFFCCGKSTERHRIRTIKHGASWGSISSAWRVLHHAKLWLLQPHTSNLLHFPGPVSVVWYRSA